MIDEKLIKRCFPTCKNPERWTLPFEEFLPQFKITTPLRQAHFFAQVGHESGDLNHTKENLNYSRDGLLKIFKKYFTKELAEQYARKPQLIASRVYGNRMGNGDEASQDGWRFSGRGLIQLTGKTNYMAFTNATGTDVLKDPGYLETYLGAVHSACWFWSERGLNALADNNDLITITKRINGGVHGYEDRKNRFTRCKQILSV